MSDRGYRQNQRNAFEAGDPESLRRQLRDQIRNGEMPLHRAQMLAYLGDENANIVLEDDAPNAEQDTRTWIEHMVEIGGHEVLIQVAYAIYNLRMTEDYSKQINLHPLDKEHIDEARVLIDQMMQNPSEQHNHQLFTFYNDHYNDEIEYDTVSGLPTLLLSYNSAIQLMSELVLEARLVDEDEITNSFRMLLESAYNDEFGSGLSDEQIRTAIKERLIPWLYNIDNKAPDLE